MNDGGVAQCNICFATWAENVPAIGMAMLVWHVFENHRNAWLRVVGDRSPTDPDPRRQEVRTALTAEYVLGHMALAKQQREEGSG